MIRKLSMFAFSTWTITVTLLNATASDFPPEDFNRVFPKATVLGQEFRFDSKADYFVFAFLGVECPVARQYGAKLQPLADRYNQQRVQFIGINSNPQDSPEEVAEYQSDFKIAFSMLKDSTQEVAKFFSATRTAEVVVTDRKGQIHYRGRIDDQFSPGVTRGETTSHDLRDALDALVSGLPVAVSETSPVGCIITYLKEALENPTVTFTRDVAPVLWKNCHECHRSGEIGPFDISEYDDLLGWGEMLVEVMQQKRMPPWHASPEYGSFRNERLLPEGVIELVQEWIDQGMPYGDPADLPPLPTYTEGWRLPREPDLIVAMRDRPFRVPADQTVDYQYLVVDPGITEDRWISASQIVPGAPSVVHHSIVFVRPPDISEFVGIGWLNAYVPGQIPVIYPPGYARKIPAGSKLVFQQHYTPSGIEQMDTTIIGMNFIDESQVTHQVFTLVAIDQDFEIPPHAPAHTVRAQMQGSPPFGELLAISPHMHLRGKAFEVFAERGGTMETILKVPNYDFNWQHTYEYRNPIELSNIEKVTIAATFDNSRENPFNPNPDEYVMWGDQTWEEMTLGYFDVAVPIRPPSSDSSIGQHPVGKPGTNAEDDSSTPEQSASGRAISLGRSRHAAFMDEESAARFADDFLKRYDSNRDGVLTMREVTTIFRDYGFWIVDSDRDGKITRLELIKAARGDLEFGE